MNNEWLPTEEELENREETTDEKLERLQNTIDYLMGRDEYKRMRSEKHQNKQLNNPARYTRIYKVKNRELNKGKVLTKPEKAFIFDLQGYVSLDNGLIVDDRGAPMDIKKIMKVCDIGRSTFYTIVGRLVELGIILQVTNEEPGKTYYRFNPEYIE